MDKLKGTHNYTALMKQEGLIEQLKYGVLDVSTEFHNSKITKQTFYGKERRLYGKDNTNDALKDVLKRMTNSIEDGESTRLQFLVDIRRGKIVSVVWISEIDVVY